MGPGLAFDPTRFFIFCANVLGSPYGSSSPVSINPATGKRWGPEFPRTAVRDDVRLQKVLLDSLGVTSVAAVVGGSMGGMAVLEWPLCTPTGYVRNIVPIATSARHSAWGISWGEAQRQSIYSDPKYSNGYYPPDDPPLTGLAAARMAALLTYRSRDSFESRFGRTEMQSKPSARQQGWDMPRTPAERALAAHNDGMKLSSPALASNPVATEHSANKASLAEASTSTSTNGATSDTTDVPLIFSAQSYLRYQGDKFVSRFDANCYISITRKMDSHDLSRGRAPWPGPLRELPAHTLLIAISSDGLFTISEMQELADCIPNGRLVIVDSPEGHDGFLLEFEQINAHLLKHLRDRLPSIYSGEPLIDMATQKADFKVAKTSVFGEAEAEASHSIDITRW